MIWHAGASTRMAADLGDSYCAPRSTPSRATRRRRDRVALETELIPSWEDSEAIGRCKRCIWRARQSPTRRPWPAAIDAERRRLNRGLMRAATSKRLPADLAVTPGPSRRLRQFDAGEKSSRRIELQMAGPGFALGGSPYRYWGAIYGAVSAFAARRFDTAQEYLAAGDPRGVDRRYRYLAGRRSWIRGLILGNAGDFMAAVPRYESALADCDAIGEQQSALALRAVLAENLSRLGIPIEAWRHELSALARMTLAGPPRRQHLILEIASGLFICSTAIRRPYAFAFKSLVASSDGKPQAMVTECLSRRGSCAPVILKLRDDLAGHDYSPISF